jgi:hypothetical protein
MLVQKVGEGTCKALTQARMLQKEKEIIVINI